MLRAQTADFIRTLALSRPDAGNALNGALADVLQRAVDDVRADEKVRALIITGGDAKFFCAGGDVKEYSAISTEPELFDAIERLERLFQSIGALHIPVIAAINGYALGAGAELALACDFRIMGSEARMGFAQASIGVLPTCYSLRRLRGLCGRAVASELILGAANLSAPQAVAKGLAHEIVASGAEHRAAMDLGRRLAENCPLALRAAKRLLSVSAAEMDAEFRRVLPELWFSPFHRAAEKKFSERRRLETRE